MALFALIDGSGLDHRDDSFSENLCVSSGEVKAYVLTEFVPGDTVIAVDGCSSDHGLRGADAYLLHVLARWWGPRGCRWVNDGPAASAGIREHKSQHHGLEVLRLLRYQVH